MKRVSRRAFIRHSAAGAVACGIPRLAWSAGRRASDEIRLGVIGLGGIDVPGSVGGRGRQLIERIGQVAGARVAALCDVDESILAVSRDAFAARGEKVTTAVDLRRLLDDARLDAVVVATPNHWHALATVWACQAGKDVYVEKPFSYNIWEGRQMVAAARKYGRMVQNGTQRRSSPVLREAFAALRQGELGKIRAAHAIVYRVRESIGRRGAALPIPATVDYDLWCGPAPLEPPRRNEFHYHWHWFWNAGNGEIGNNGAHMIDICRWALGQESAPPRAMSIGGRLSWNDDGETPNTQIAVLDYEPAPLVCEVRSVLTSKAAGAIGNYRGSERGIVVDCEDGYFAGDMGGGAFYDRQGRSLRQFKDPRKTQAVEVDHMANFVAAIRSRQAAQLNAEAAIGHLSTIGVHMANTSYRLGQQPLSRESMEAIAANAVLAEAYGRLGEYLKTNGVDMARSPLRAGPWVAVDPQNDRFTGELATEANRLDTRAYRAPFVVPEIA